jgi:hypothetical protein
LQTFIDIAERLSGKIDAGRRKPLWNNLLHAESAVREELCMVGEMGVGLQWGYLRGRSS